MVDALTRAARLLPPEGLVLDLHPAPEPAVLRVGDRDAGGDPVGILDAPAALERHAHADAAVRAAAAAGTLALEHVAEFLFRRYADSIDELCDFVAQKSSEGRFPAETIARAREAHRLRPEASLWLEERVRAATLRPPFDAAQGAPPATR